MAGESLQYDPQDKDPSTLGMIMSSVITVVTLLGLWYCFRRASTLFPRGISIPLDNFIAGQQTRGRGPIALSDDDWRDAEALEDGLYVEHEEGVGENYEYVDHPHRPLDSRAGARPLLPFTTADTQRLGHEQGRGDDYEDDGDNDDDDACGLLGRNGGGGGREDDDYDDDDNDDIGENEVEDVGEVEAMVYDIGSDDDDEEDTAIRAPYKDDRHDDDDDDDNDESKKY